jgi:hypothetical protein
MRFSIPRQRIGWRQRVVSAFTEHLPLKASALLVTVALWFVVAAREPTPEVVGVRFAPQLDSGVVLRDPAPMIRAEVRGRPSEILKLSTTPLMIRRHITGDTPDTLVLALRTSDVEVPEGIEVIVDNVQPQALTLRFDTTVSRVVPVRSALVARFPFPSITGTPNAVRLDPPVVTIAGPRLNVARIRFVATVAESVAFSDTLPHLVDLDTAGLGVVVRPPQVKATPVVLPQPH